MANPRMRTTVSILYALFTVADPGGGGGERAPTLQNIMAN